MRRQQCRCLMLTYLAVEFISHGLVLVSQHACQALLLLKAPHQVKLLLQAASSRLRALFCSEQ